MFVKVLYYPELAYQFLCIWWVFHRVFCFYTPKISLRFPSFHRANRYRFSLAIFRTCSCFPFHHSKSSLSPYPWTRFLSLLWKLWDAEPQQYCSVNFLAPKCLSRYLKRVSTSLCSWRECGLTASTRQFERRTSYCKLVCRKLLRVKGLINAYI